MTHIVDNSRERERKPRSGLAIAVLLVFWLTGSRGLKAQVVELDRIILNNGDHFTGRVVSSTSELVSLATDAAGTISVRRSAIQQLILANEQPKSIQVQPASAHASSNDGGGSAPTSSWVLGFQGTPDKVVLGTQSQEQFGAMLGLSFSEGSMNNTTNLTAKGSHSRTYKVKSAAIQTDVAGAELEQQHFLSGPKGAAVFGVAELFTNNSLGMAMQKSFGIGILSPQYKAKKLFYDFDIDMRYVSEHLDHSSARLDLGAVRIKQQMHSQGVQFSWNEEMWIMPMLNNVHALQGYASLGPSLSIKPWLKLGLSEEESYLGNAPRPNRKNYFASVLSLTIQGGSGATSR